MTTTHDTRAHLLAAVRAHPDEDTPRLVYADWLQEYGDDADRARAEFIRVQVELAKVPPPPDDGTVVPSRYVCEHCMAVTPFESDTSSRPRMCWNCHSYSVRKLRAADDHAERRAALRARERELLAGDYPPIRGNRVRFLQGGGEERNPYAWIGMAGYAMDWCEFRRGFVEHVTCSGDDWCAHADAILASHPVRAVTLTRWPDLPHYVRRRDPGGETVHGFRVAGVLVEARLRDATAENLTPFVLSRRWPGVTFHPPPEMTGAVTGSVGSITGAAPPLPREGWAIRVRQRGRYRRFAEPMTAELTLIADRIHATPLGGELTDIRARDQWGREWFVPRAVLVQTSAPDYFPHDHPTVTYTARAMGEFHPVQM
jgi:uncharacterized protein (TIGR02996 family)